MKKPLLSLLFAVCTATLFAQVPVAGLVAYYPLNGNAHDSASLALHGNEVNAVYTMDRFGNKFSAIALAGNQSYVEVPGHDSLYPRQYTYSLWFNAHNFPPIGQIQTFLSVGGTDCDQTMTINNGYLNYTGVYASVYYGYNPNRVFSVGDTHLPAISQWHHIVSVKSSDSLKIFVNGVLKQAGIANSPPCYEGPVKVLRIGARVGIHFFNGYIDDVRIYNRPLDVTEVKALFEENLPTFVDSYFDVKNGVIIYPNPSANGQFQLFADDEITSLEVTDPQGKSIYQSNLPGNQLDLAGIAAGAYFVKIMSGGQQSIQKILIH